MEWWLVMFALCRCFSWLLISDQLCIENLWPTAFGLWHNLPKILILLLALVNGVTTAAAGWRLNFWRRPLLPFLPASLPPCFTLPTPRKCSSDDDADLDDRKLREIQDWRHILQRCLKFKFTYIIKNFKLCYLSQSLVIWKAFPRIQFS